MAYDLMLLGDPGTERERVLQALREDPQITPDPELETRFWLETAHGRAQINIGSKDPVESVHLEFPADTPPLMEAASRKALELAARLEMRLEDMLWGREVTEADFPALREYWRTLMQGNGHSPPPSPAKPRPWWRPW
jgi:hypothetical protein